MYFHLHRDFKKWIFYSIKILKCEPFLIALRRNSKKWIFVLCKILKSRPFLIALPKNAKKLILPLRKKILKVGPFNRLA